jgi:hypothetical protein
MESHLWATGWEQDTGLRVDKVRSLQKSRAVYWIPRWEGKDHRTAVWQH